MSYTTLTSYQVALLALVPKRQAVTATRLARDSNLSPALVEYELRGLVAAGHLVFDPNQCEYRLAGETHAGS